MIIEGLIIGGVCFLKKIFIILNIYTSLIKKARKFKIQNIKILQIFNFIKIKEEKTIISYLITYYINDFTRF